MKKIKNINCEDFNCLFAGTELCVENVCEKCKMHLCRGCVHLFDCIEEQNIIEVAKAKGII